MIFHFLLNIVVVLIGGLLFFLPEGSRLPFGIDEPMVTAAGWVHALMDVFWPMEIMLTVVLYYMLFRVSILVIKLFIGHRAP